MDRLRIGALPLADDNWTVEVTMQRSDGAEFVQHGDSIDLDKAIRELAFARLMMEPPIETDFIDDPKRTRTAACRYAFVASETGKDRALAFLHPSFGSLAFGLDDDQALNLARSLQRDVPARI